MPVLRTVTRCAASHPEVIPAAHGIGRSRPRRRWNLLLVSGVAAHDEAGELATGDFPMQSWGRGVSIVPPASPMSGGEMSLAASALRRALAWSAGPARPGIGGLAALGDDLVGRLAVQHALAAGVVGGVEAAQHLLAREAAAAIGAPIVAAPANLR